MKAFFRTLLAVIIGILLINFLLLTIFMGVVASLEGDSTIAVKPNSVLRIDFSTPIVDRVSTDVRSLMDWQNLSMSQSVALQPALEAIRHAATDEDIEGISLAVEDFAVGMANGEEIRNELMAFKESGKFIYAYANSYGQLPYWMATVADSIFMNPSGTLEWSGLSAEILYLKDAMAKYGVEPQIVRHGKFKSAVEPFLASAMSDANREQTQTYLGSLWGHITAGVAEARSLAEASLHRIADERIVLEGSEVLEERLIDGLFYKDQYDSLLVARAGADTEGRPNVVELADYAEYAAARVRVNLKDKKIAVLYASGEIKDGDGTETYIMGDGYAEVIDALRRDSSIAAVVLRVNSPGGSALASDIIWRELVRLKADKPLVVSMGGYAASGGYYISSPADYVVCNPTTITGSIGVFGMYMTFGKLLREKIGINPQVVKTNSHSDMGSSFRPLDPVEAKAMQRSVELVYSTFIDRVGTGRGMTLAAVDSIGQGRVWSGIDAEGLGLVDELGGLTRAIEVAAERANLDSYRLSAYPKVEEDPVSMLLGKILRNGAVARLFPESGVSQLDGLQEQLREILSRQGIRAQMPYQITIR